MWWLPIKLYLKNENIYIYISGRGLDCILGCSLLIPSVGHMHQQSLIQNPAGIRRHFLPGIAPGCSLPFSCWKIPFRFLLDLKLYYKKEPPRNHYDQVYPKVLYPGLIVGPLVVSEVTSKLVWHLAHWWWRASVKYHNYCKCLTLIPHAWMKANKRHREAMLTYVLLKEMRFWVEIYILSGDISLVNNSPSPAC